MSRKPEALGQMCAERRNVPDPQHDRLSLRLANLRRSIALLLESIESYERNGTRTADKLICDGKIVVSAIFDVMTEVSR